MGTKTNTALSAIIIFIGFSITCEGASRISGGAYFYPENTIYRASFSMDIKQAEGSAPEGWFKYYYTRTRLNVVSTGINKIEGIGKTATVSGSCSVNGSGGYSFTLKITDTTPDLFGIEVKKQDGTVYYRIGPKSISGGDLIVSLPPPIVLGIAILSPSDNSTVTTPGTIVSGTFISPDDDVGISVNGMPAAVNARNWASNLPLINGSNTISAKIVDIRGNSALTSITLNRAAAPESISLSAYPEGGIAPLEVSFSLSVPFSPAPENYQIDFEGDGVIDATLQNIDNLTKTYALEGIYSPTVTATDSLGTVHKTVGVVCVMSRNQIDSLLKRKWEEMKQALQMKDIDKSISFFLEQSRETYQYNFDLLKDHLPEIVRDMGEIRMVNIENRVAEYEMLVQQDGVEYSFYIKFVKDLDGIWRIHFF